MGFWAVLVDPHARELKAPNGGERGGSQARTPRERFRVPAGSHRTEELPVVPSGGALAVLTQAKLTHAPGGSELQAADGGLHAIEAFERSFAAIEDALSAVLERLGGVKRRLEHDADPEAGEIDTIGTHLAAVEQALAALPAGQYLVALDSKFEAIEARGNDVSTAVALMDERLAAVETAAWASKGIGERLHAEVSALSQSIARQRSEVANTVSEHLLEGLSAMDQSIAKRQADGAAAATRIYDRLERTEAALGASILALADRLSRGESEPIEAVIGPLLERMEAADEGMQQRHGQALATIGAMDGRLAQIEAGLMELGRTFLEPCDRLGRDFDQMQDNLLALNANQAAIATSMDMWREDTLADLGTIGGRLEAIERLSFRTAQVAEALALSMQDLHYLAAKNDAWRNRLSRFLFGGSGADRSAWSVAAESPSSRQNDFRDAFNRLVERLSINGTLRSIKRAIRPD